MVTLCTQHMRAHDYLRMVDTKGHYSQLLWGKRGRDLYYLLFLVSLLDRCPRSYTKISNKCHVQLLGSHSILSSMTMDM